MRSRKEANEAFLNPQFLPLPLLTVFLLFLCILLKSTEVEAILYSEK